MKKILHTLAALALTLTIIGFAVTATLAFKPLYYLDIGVLGISEETGYSVEEIKENYDALIDYNLAFGDAELEFPSLAMSEEGRIHFEEVKVIFDIFKYAAVIGAVLCAVIIFIFKKRREYLYLKITSVLCIALPAVVGILVATNWDWFFVAFHKLVFNNDYWLFDPVTDPVINILPDEFFMHCAILILVLVVAGSVICGLVYRRLKRKQAGS